MSGIGSMILLRYPAELRAEHLGYAPSSASTVRMEDRGEQRCLMAAHSTMAFVTGPGLVTAWDKPTWCQCLSMLALRTSA